MNAPFFDGRQACAGADLSLFFPDHGTKARELNEAAKHLCRICPHAVACLEYALTVPLETGGYVHGTWAGTSFDERREIRRRRERAA